MKKTYINSRTSSSFAPRYGLVARELQRLPFSLLQRVLDFLPPFKFTLTRQQYLQYDDEYQQGKILYTPIIQTLYGYFRKDFSRRPFLVWVNVDVINLDVPHVKFSRMMIPWKRMKYFRFFNDYPEFVVDDYSVDMFIKAENSVLHTVDMSYWNLDESMTGALNYEGKEKQQNLIKKITSMNLSHSSIPEELMAALIMAEVNIKFLDISHVRPINLANQSCMQKILCSLKNLSTLAITVDHLGTQVAHAFMNSTKLHKLYMNMNSCDAGCLSLLLQSTRLRDLTFIVNNSKSFVMNPEDLTLFVPKNFQGSRVERLELSDTVLLVEHCASITSLFPNATKLFLHNCGLRDAHICALILGRSDSLPLLDSSVAISDIITDDAIRNNIKEIGLGGNFFTLSAVKLVCHYCPVVEKITLTESEFLSEDDLENFIDNDPVCRDNIQIMY
jgi:hypothetical protein